MPDARLQRTRDTLSSDYQFGDSAVLGREVRECLARRDARFIREHGVALWEHDRQRRAREAAQAADDADDARDAADD